MAETDHIDTAVEHLTDKGSSGFLASAIARRIGTNTEAVLPRLAQLVSSGDLTVRYDLLCPDNGRTIKRFSFDEELPIGQEWTDDRCDGPFVVSESDFWVMYVPTERFRLNVRRRRSRQGDPPSEDDASEIRRLKRRTPWRHSCGLV